MDFVQRCAPTDSGLGEPGVPENVREILVRPIARPMPKVSNTADCDANSRRRARKPIELSGLRLPGKRPYRRVFGLYASLPIDYVDAYHAALMESRPEPEFFSYDTDFDRGPSLRRAEP